jgi:hypothetical protein
MGHMLFLCYLTFNFLIYPFIIIIYLLFTLLINKKINKYYSCHIGLDIINFPFSILGTGLVEL